METTVYRFVKKRIGSAKVSLKAMLSRVVVFFTKDILRFFSNVLLPAVALDRSKKVVDLVASDSANEIDLGSHGFKGKDELTDVQKKSIDEGLEVIKLQTHINNEIKRIEVFYGITFLFAQSEAKKVELVFCNGVL
jgi:hypothetical protein